jgi:hypothetical protein
MRPLFFLGWGQLVSHRHNGMGYPATPLLGSWGSLDNSWDLKVTVLFKDNFLRVPK